MFNLMKRRNACVLFSMPMQRRNSRKAFAPSKSPTFHHIPYNYFITYFSFFVFCHVDTDLLGERKITVHAFVFTAEAKNMKACTVIPLYECTKGTQGGERGRETREPLFLESLKKTNKRKDTGKHRHERTRIRTHHRDLKPSPEDSRSQQSDPLDPRPRPGEN